MRRIIILLLNCLLSFSTFGQHLYYVSTETTAKDDQTYGKDSSYPWRTLSYAEAHATTPGDTIALRAGDVFQRNSVLQITHSGDKINDITWDGTLWGSPGDTAIIQSIHDGTDAYGFTTVRFADCRYVTFQHIIIDGNKMKRFGVTIGGDQSYDGPPDQHDEHNITIQGCEIKNVGSTTSEWRPGILLRCNHDTISDIIIKNNYIHDIAAHGIAIYANRLSYGASASAITKNIYIGYNTIRRIRVFTGNTGNGMHITRQADNIMVEHNTIVTSSGDAVFSVDPINENGNQLKVNHLTVRYNWFESDADDGLPVFYFEPQTDLSYAFYAKVYGNVIVANGNHPKGVSFSKTVNSDFSGSSIEFYNNTVISNYNSTFQESLNGEFIVKNNIFVNRSEISGQWAYIVFNGTTTHSNNLYYTPAIGNVIFVKEDQSSFNKDGILSWEPSAIVNEPLFARFPYNFHLVAGSPAIGKGVPIDDYIEDIEGTPVGDHPNLGCFQTLAGDKEPELVFGKVEDVTPNVVQLFFDLFLDATSVPPVSAFDLNINGQSKTINIVQISGPEVRLQLPDSIEFGNTVTISYTMPGTDNIRSVYGKEASSFSNKQVQNNILDHNLPPEAPVVLLQYASVSYSGFIGTFDASESYDKQGKPLSFSWDVPDTIPVSSTSNSKIFFLAPMINKNSDIDFSLHISNGDSVSIKNFSVNIVPYFQYLPASNLNILEASDSAPPHLPENSIDDDFSTWWAADGLDQWLTFQLEKASLIHHLEVSFMPGQQRSSYFDILASNDSQTWIPIQIGLNSCDFSDKTQIFPFPVSESGNVYSYLKLVGHGNSQDSWNAFSEIRIRSTPVFDSLTITISPNPAVDHIHLLIQGPQDLMENPAESSWTFNILDMTRILVYQELIPAGTRELDIPLNLSAGVYVVQLITGPLTMNAKKLIIIK